MQFADLDLDKVYTYADYYSWPFDERVELIKGKIYKMPSAGSTNHQIMVGAIHTQLWNFLEEKHALVFLAPFDVRFPHQANTADDAITTVLQPDLCVICDLNKIDDRGCVGVPDIVVEVLSPGDNSRDLKDKYKVDEEAGVRECWVVSPQNHMFMVHINVDGKFRLLRVKTRGDVITTPILPGFSMDLTDLFSEVENIDWG